MYDVDGRDVLLRDDAIPTCDPGAPLPVVVADDLGATVAYFAPSRVNWDTARPEDLGEEEVVVLRFRLVHSLMFGAPNDEALHGHPLADHGLEPYAAYRVRNSSWVRRLEQMNRVHRQHQPEHFSRLKHFILTFHDTTFECVAPDDPEVSVVPATNPHQAAIAAAHDAA
jgi:hypothetical protein